MSNAENDRPSLDLTEMEKWVQDHGSPRLKKSYAAGLLPVSKGVYRSERLALERPGWRFFADKEPFRFSQIVNPHEDGLDALLDARDDWPTTRLVWLQPKDAPGEAWLMDDYLGRQIGIAVTDYFEDDDGPRPAEETRGNGDHSEDT